MLVRSLRLQNFRNYVTQEIELPSGLIALIGENGQGKTNLLEAFCVLATTKSPLVERDRELIRWQQIEARLLAHIELGAGMHPQRPDQRRLEYSWRVTGKALAREMKADGVPQSQLAHWLGQLQVVAFFPHDLTLVTGEPAERRRFLNLELGKAHPLHFTEVARYRRALQQRNALLKQYLEARWKRSVPAPQPGALTEWNRQLISYGARVFAARAYFLQELQPLADATHRKLSGLDKAFAIEYVPGVKQPPNKPSVTGETDWTHLLTSSLDQDHDTDARRGTTNSGPHRDEIVFTLDGMDLRRYGSQGQQRLAILATKIALAHWVAQETGEAPILLLDDALSELDAPRRALVLEEAAQFPQSVLTATDARFLENVPATIFEVKNGHVYPCQPGP